MNMQHIGTRAVIVNNSRRHHHFVKNEEVKILKEDKEGFYVTNNKQWSWVPRADVSLGTSGTYPQTRARNSMAAA